MVSHGFGRKYKGGGDDGFKRERVQQKRTNGMAGYNAGRQSAVHDTMYGETASAGRRYDFSYSEKRVCL